MSIIGWRKLISTVSGVAGIVLVNHFNIPPEQVGNLSDNVVQLLPVVISTVSILGVVWKQLTEQSKVDQAQAGK